MRARRVSLFRRTIVRVIACLLLSSPVIGLSAAPVVTAAQPNHIASGAMDVSVGGSHACVLMADGTAKCWGDNEFGQLGDGTTVDRSAPVAVSGLTGVTAVSAANLSTCALLGIGTVRCWGRNGDGELGNGTTIDSPVPVAVSGLTGATAISDECAIVAGGAVKCWGYGYGSTPVSVPGLTGATAISSQSGGHTCVLVNGGAAKCWGWNSDGELGDRTTNDSTTPVSVVGLTGAVKISVGTAILSSPTGLAVGGSYSCALLSSGSVKCWGNNFFGNIGSATLDHSATPIIVPESRAAWTSQQAVPPARSSRSGQSSAGDSTTTAKSAMGTPRIPPLLLSSPAWPASGRSRPATTRRAR